MARPLLRLLLSLWKRTEEKSAPRRPPISFITDPGVREVMPEERRSASCSAAGSSMILMTRLLGSQASAAERSPLSFAVFFSSLSFFLSNS